MLLQAAQAGPRGVAGRSVRADTMEIEDNGRGADERPAALSLLASERPRNVGSLQAGALLFGDWGTSRLYVLGLAFLVAGRSSFWLIGAMSLLILVVSWAYTHICRLYPDGGGVYTAGRRRKAILGVVGALLLFADYTITASLSSVEAFHYFGLGKTPEQTQQVYEPPGEHIKIPEPTEVTHAETERLRWYNRPDVWAIVAIVMIGAFNLLGPKHTAGFAIFAAAGMIVITLLIVVFALPKVIVHWDQIDWGSLTHPPLEMWQGFVYIVLALSGVEAIANLTGVMKKPVFKTARKSIYLVAVEVALFNVLLAVAMIALAPGREAHKEDMLAFMAQEYIGDWGEWPVRIIGGLLLLSATNTAVNGLMSITYVMSRDGELPSFLQKLNGFGAPWVGAIVAAGVPAIVLLFFHDLETLASLYAIGVVGAVALNCILAGVHPRLRKTWRKVMIFALGLLLVLIWITLAITKLPALIFVTTVLTVGLALRQLTRYAQARRPKPSLLRQAIIEQLTEEALAKPKFMLATAGGTTLAEAAIKKAKAEGASLVVCFVREVALNYRVSAETRLTLDTDEAAEELFTDFLEVGHREGVPIIPMYDSGLNGPELIAEAAALNGVQKVLIGSSRRGAIHQMIKGSFQRRLESLLPPEIPVEVLAVEGPKRPPVEKVAS
jgi:amino acid transporter